MSEPMRRCWFTVLALAVTSATSVLWAGEPPRQVTVHQHRIGHPSRAKQPLAGGRPSVLGRVPATIPKMIRSKNQLEAEYEEVEREFLNPAPRQPTRSGWASSPATVQATNSLTSAALLPTRTSLPPAPPTNVQPIPVSVPTTRSPVVPANHLASGPVVTPRARRQCNARCRRRCRCCAPAEAHGSVINAYLNAHIAKGATEQLVLYQYDFQFDPSLDTTELRVAGRRKLSRLMPLLASTGSPLIIEPTAGRADIDEARRMRVIEFLSLDAEFGISNVEVLVKDPVYRGLEGSEATVMDTNRLQTLRTRGPISRGSASSTSGISFGTSSGQSSGRR